MQTTTSIQPMGTFDDPRYAKLALESAGTYQSAEPFPHIAFPDFLPASLAQAVADAFPGPNSIEWIIRDNEHNLKRYQHDETMMPPLLRAMLREFNSRQFVLFLEALTGIDNLIPDPYFIGGGIHLSQPGDFLKVHADFNWHHKLHAHRRVNVLFYPNPGWQDAWGGALELWDKEMKSAQKRYFPRFNQLLVFNTDEHSNHGHPHALSCPPGQVRRTLNLYYYTTKTTEEVASPHFTLYKTEASPFATQLGTDYRKTAERG